MHQNKILSTILISVALLMPCHAETESLLMGPGNMVQVDVIDTPDLTPQVRVTDSGGVSLAYSGEVKLAGLTPGKAAEIIKDALVEGNVMLHPQVVVRSQEHNTQDVSVVDQVRTPSTYSVTTVFPTLKIISLAGGLTDMADRHITFKRKQGASAPVSYYLANNADDAISGGVTGYPGHIVVVQRAPIVYVLFDVARLGGYAMHTTDSQLTLLQAISMAGSANKTSATSKVNKTDKRSLERTWHILGSRGVPQMGLVLNAVKVSGGAQYRYYGDEKLSPSGSDLHA